MQLVTSSDMGCTRRTKCHIEGWSIFPVKLACKTYNLCHRFTTAPQQILRRNAKIYFNLQKFRENILQWYFEIKPLISRNFYSREEKSINFNTAKTKICRIFRETILYSTFLLEQLISRYFFKKMHYWFDFV